MNVVLVPRWQDCHLQSRHDENLFLILKFKTVSTIFIYLLLSYNNQYT